MIKEVIIVEGRDDEAAVKKAVDAEVIITHGFGISSNTYKRIETAYQNKGIIIFTDPDYSGEVIRKKLSDGFPDAKHAYLTQNKAEKKGNIGIENALPKDIIEALNKVKAEVSGERKEFLPEDLNRYLLSGNHQASYYRQKVGDILGIGYGNAHTFLKRLNNYNITREEFEEAVNTVIKSEE